MSARPLYDNRTVTLDTSGEGQVTFGPGRPNTFWVINQITVRTSTNKREPIARVYRGDVNQGSLRSGTYSGSDDTDSEFRDGPLFPGEYYTCRWTRGDNASVATVTFIGTEYTGESPDGI